jgi:fluoroacetyl-CoA thioesterase
MIQPGQSAEVEQVVTPELTADALGNRGVKVFATPFVVCLIENAAIEVLKGHLPPGAATVGTTVEMKHLAATPLGMKVRAKATLVETDGRRYVFHVECFDEVEKIAEAKHERFTIPNLERFLERAMKKGKS